MSRDEFYEKIINEKKRTGIHLGYFQHEMDVYCPYCGHAQDHGDMWEDLPREHETWERFKCYGCKKTFRVRTDVLFSTEKSKQPNKEDDDDDDGD